MQLEEPEEDNKSDHNDNPNPNQTQSQSQHHDQHYGKDDDEYEYGEDSVPGKDLKSLSQLVTENDFGGDKIIYSVLSDVFESCYKDETLAKLFDQNFMEFLLNTKGNKNLPNIKEDDQKSYYFCGYPDFDMIRQIAIVLHLWNQLGKFPIKFKFIPGFNDDTQSCIEHLNTLTPLVNQLFGCLVHSSVPQMLVNPVIDLMTALGQKGVQTILGLRNTVGSQDVPWPTKKTLKDGFNRPHTVLTDEERLRQKNPPSKLTVGARALTKHAHRSSEGWWGDVRGSESLKNAHADSKAEIIIENCVWINVHILPHSEIIVECRVVQGYGIRWTIKGMFRGFLEPQMEGGHDKGWKH